MGQSIFNGYGYNQPNQFTQPNQNSQFNNFTQPHRPTSVMDLLSQFNTFANEYHQQFGNADPKSFVTQMMQSNPVPQDQLNKIGQVANVLRNLMP